MAAGRWPTCAYLCSDAAALARTQRAADAGAIELAVAALQAHPEVAGVQEECCRVVGSVCFGTDAAGIARKQRAAGAGAMELVVAAMQAHATRVRDEFDRVAMQATHVRRTL